MLVRMFAYWFGPELMCLKDVVCVEIVEASEGNVVDLAESTKKKKRKRRKRKRSEYLYEQ